MHIPFFLLGIICLLLLAYSIKLFIKQFKLKEIAYFELTEKDKTFKIKDPGLHSICIVGLSSGFSVYNLKASIIAPNGKETILKTNKIRNGSLRKQTRTIEQWSFQLNQKGTYILKLNDLEQFIKLNPFLKTHRFFSNRKIETTSLKLQVKQTVPLKERIISIIGLVFGINGSIWGLMLGLNPNIFEQN